MKKNSMRQSAKIRHNLISEFDDKISHFITEIQSAFLRGRTFYFSNETKEKFKIYYGISTKRRYESYELSMNLLDYILGSSCHECIKTLSKEWHSVKEKLGEALRKEYKQQWSYVTQELDIKLYNKHLTAEEFSEEIHASETKMLQSFKTQSRRIIDDNSDISDIPDNVYNVILIEQSNSRVPKIIANFKQLIHNIPCQYINIDTDEQNTPIKSLDDLRKNIKNIPRPPVYGSELLQMRHVTPYSFILHTVQHLFSNEFSYEYSVDGLMETIKSFPPRSGLCVKESDLSKISTEIEIYLKVITDQNKYCFIYDTPLIDQAPINRANAALLHHEKWPKVIDYFGKIIKNIPQYEPSKVKIFYPIVLYILRMFNQRLYAAFPEEGNTVKYEIRLYKTEEEAKQSSPKNYTLLSHNAIAQRIDNDQDRQNFNRKISVVDNEGTVVDQTIKALTTLQKILNLNIPKEVLNPAEQDKVQSTKLLKRFDTLISSYNKKNASIIVDKEMFEEHYYSELEKSNFVQNYVYHIVRHLYEVFDCKPLEKKVFVPASQNNHDHNKIEVWRFREINEYCVMDGAQYREREINNANNKNYTIEFRNRIPEDQFQSMLSQALVKHIIVSSILFPQLFQISPDNGDASDKICKEFIKYVQHHYQYGNEFYNSTFTLYNDHCSDSSANTSFSTVLSGELNHHDV